jgi:hypothetical protein
MAALGNTGVLTRVQEARLSVILQKGLALERLGEAVAAARGCPPAAVAPADLAAAGGAESAADAAQRLANQREAKDLLMQHNVRLVVNIAKRYTGNGIELADLIPGGWPPKVYVRVCVGGGPTSTWLVPIWPVPMWLVPICAPPEESVEWLPVQPPCFPPLVPASRRGHGGPVQVARPLRPLQGLQVLHLRTLVDPAGHLTRRLR